MTDRLLPCPFCGGAGAVEPAKPFENIVLWLAICSRCHIMARGFAERAEAIAAWNRRLPGPVDGVANNETIIRVAKALCRASSIGEHDTDWPEFVEMAEAAVAAAPKAEPVIDD